MHEAGAKFGGICLVHHDGFLLWDSEVSRWSSKNMGPKRDFHGEIAAAVRKYDDMKLLATFHHGRTFGYCTGAMKEDDITDQMRETSDVFDPKMKVHVRVALERVACVDIHSPGLLCSGSNCGEFRY